ncbi:MAG TPA: c-type cytochrome [Dissulfurispiraceae bacterium]|nr:c-type cytochrome [Dissulfurispiraceae bacterium]
MKKIPAVSVAALSLFAFIAAGSFAAEEKGEKYEKKKISGKAEFQEHCSVCHPDGGNIVNPAKTLHKKDLDANGVKKVSDIVAKMRNPGPGMTQFDKKTISDKEAKAIAEYILKTFK